jgi:hypothetical protein
MAENTETAGQKSKREAFLERLKSKYPDDNFDDEEVLYGRLGEHFDDAENRLNEYGRQEEELNKMFAADPRSATYLSRWRKGGDPAVELIRMFGDEVKDALDDPKKQEAIAEAHKDYLERVTKSKELEEEYNKNLETSLEEMDKFQEAHGLTDEELDNVSEFIMTIVTDGISGKILPETLEMALKALNHDVDVAAAGHEGEVKGKNAKITEKLLKEGSGDGTAVMGGQNGVPTNQVPKRKTIFDLASEAK